MQKILILVSFLLLTVLYFSPVFFDGKELPQHDILQYKGSSKDILDHREKFGEEPLWTNGMFSGMPSYLISVAYPNDVSKLLLTVATLGLPHPYRIVFLCLVSGFLFGLSLRVNPLIAALGAIGFTFATFTMISIEAGHNSKVLAIACGPMIFAGIQWAFDRKYLLGAAVASLGLALELTAGHLQITYYILIAVVCWGIAILYKTIKEKSIKEFSIAAAVLIGAVVLAVGTNYVKLASTIEYSKYSTRGKSELNSVAKVDAQGLDRDYAFAWSQGVWENLTFIIPNMFGGPSSSELSVKSATYNEMINNNIPKGTAKQYVKNMPTYWGSQSFVAGPIYMGIVIFVFAILFLVLSDSYHRYWMGAAVVIAIFLSMGKNFSSFNYFLFDYLPGYNKFRTPSMAVALAQMILPFMAVLGLAKVVELLQTSFDFYKKIALPTGIIGGFILLIIVISGFFSYESSADESLAKQASWIIDALIQDRRSMLISDAFIALLYVIAIAVVAFLVHTNKLKKEFAIYIFVALCLLDLWTVNKRYLNSDDFEKSAISNYFKPTAADQQILNDKELGFRVYNVGNPFNEAKTSYHHRSIGGYHGAKMRRYQDLIDLHLSKGNEKVFRMLNAKYALIPQEGKVQRMPNIGAAWLVESVKTVDSPDEEIEFLGNENFEPEKMAVVDRSKFDVKNTTYTADGTIDLKEIRPNYLKYEAETNGDALAVFSEIYYPLGWKTMIDGKETSHMRVNYVLRAMEIPKGKHTIEFKYEPEEFYARAGISTAVGVVLVILLLGAIAYEIVEIRKKNLKL